MKKAYHVRNSFKKLLCLALALAFVLMLGTVPAVFAEEGDAMSTEASDTLQEDVSTDGEVQETEPTDAKKEESTDSTDTNAEETPQKTEPANITTYGLTDGVSSRFLRGGEVSTDFANIVNDLQVTAAIDKVPPTPINNGESVTISVDDTLIVTYSFTISDINAEAIKASIGSDNVQYLMTFPSWLEIAEGSTELSTTGTGDQEYKYADIIVDTDGKVYIQFTGDFWEYEQNYMAGLNATKIELYCTINEEKLHEETTYKLEFDGGFSVNVTVEEDEPQDAALEKTGKYDTTLNRFVWTVTYTPGDGKVMPPLTLTDTYDNLSLNEYDEGSFGLEVTKPDGTTVTVDSSNYTLTPATSTDEGVVTCILDEIFFTSALGFTDISNGVSLADYVFVFTYYTKLTKQAFLQPSMEVKNVAVLTDADTLSLEANAVADVNPQNSLVTKKASLSQNGTFVDSGTTTGVGTQDFVWWQVEFATLDLDLKNLILYDERSPGLDLDEADFTLVAKDSTGNIIKTYTYAQLVDGNYLISSGNTQIAITIPELDNGGYATNYTLKYKTNVDPNLFLPTLDKDQNYTFTSETLTNKAWLTFKADGAGPLIELPIVSKPVTVTTNIIQKDREYAYYYPYDGTTVTNYKYNANTVRWTLRVNPHHVYVGDGATITDTIPAGLTYDDTYNGGAGTVTNGGFWNGLGIILYKKSSTGGADVDAIKTTDFTAQKDGDSYIFTVVGKDTPITLYEFAYDKDENKFSYKIDGLEDYRLAFFFYTTINDEEIADNKTTTATRKTFVNNVKFDCKVAATSDGLFTECAPTAAATVYVYSKVLEKKGKFYDYDTNEITWEVTVNHNNITMPDAKLYETIPSGQEYVPGSVFVGDSEDPLKEYSSDSAASGAETPYVVYDGTDLTIYLGELDRKTTVTFKTVVDVDNYVDAKGNMFTNSNTVIVDNTISLDNKYAEKIEASGDITINNEILYKMGESDKTGQVAYHVNINPNRLDLTEQKLTDTMPAGLELDPGSVDLYKVTVTDGKFPSVASLTDDSLVEDWEWSYDENSREFTITLPGSDSYILVYNCYVTDSTLTSVANTISFKGTLIAQNISSVKTTTHNIKGNSSFTALDNSLTIYKVDSVHTTGEDESSSPIADVTFELYYYSSVSGNEIVYRTGTTDSDGKITFLYLPLNRKFYLRETEGASGYDDTPIYLSFESNPEGEVTWEYDETEKNYALVFTTKTAAAELTYRNDPDTTTIEFLKQDDKGEKVTGAEFTLTGIANDDGVTTDYTDTVASEDGTVKFEDVPWGTYHLQEISAPSGYIIDRTVYTVIVDQDGRYVISYKDEDEEPVTVYDSNEADGKWVVENIYQPEIASVEFDAEKLLLGRDLEAGEFQFELKENETVLETASNDKDGLVTFSEITYDKVGTYVYTISEVQGSLKRVIYDGSIFTATVVVEDVDHVLVAKVTYTKDGEKQDVIFTNKFKPTVMDESYYNNLEVLKSVDKTEAKPGETITYTITAENTGDVEKDDLVIKDYLPKYTTFVSSPDGTLMKDSAGEYVEWTIDSLAPGEKLEFTFSVKVTEDAPNGHKIENTAIYGNGKTTETVTTVVKKVQGEATVTPTPKSTGTAGTSKTSGTTKTGDTTQWLLWILCAAAAAGGIVVLIRRRRRSNP